jgi:hypothetical protein
MFSGVGIQLGRMMPPSWLPGWEINPSGGPFIDALSRVRAYSAVLKWKMPRAIVAMISV